MSIILFIDGKKIIIRKCNVNNCDCAFHKHGGCEATVTDILDKGCFRRWINP